MADLTPQTTDPARDLYRFLFGIVQFASPADLVPNTSRNSTLSVYQLQGADIRVHGDGKWLYGKPPISISHFMTIWPNGYFAIRAHVRQARWGNWVRDALAKHTFLQWDYSGHGSEKIVYVQNHKRDINSAVHHTARIGTRDWQTARPYMPCDNDDMFNDDIVYKLHRVGDTDWKVKAVAVRPDQVVNHSARRARLLVQRANVDLNRRYALADARYARYERRAEIESWRERGHARPPRVRTQAQREEIIRTFIDHSIVFEPKSTPPGQIILPFTREEAMSHGR